jgi:succinylglutamate desuccinylase
MFSKRTLTIHNLLKVVALLALILAAAQAMAFEDFLRKDYSSFISSPLSVVDGPKLLADSGVEYPAYSEIEASLATLAAKHPQSAALVHYGKSLEGRNLNVLKIGLPATSSMKNPRPAVEISGAIHGNEYLGIEEPLAEFFLERQDQMPGLTQFLAAGGIIYLIPVINPDGFSARQRANRNMTDLNRDFDILPLKEKRFTQPETSALAQYLDSEITAQHVQLKLSMDYHCCVPAFILPWTYQDLQPSAIDQPAFTLLTNLQKNLLGYTSGNAAQTVGYLAAGSSIDYFYAKYGTLALTIEGREGGELGVFNQHVKFWDAVFKSIVSP